MTKTKKGIKIPPGVTCREVILRYGPGFEVPGSDKILRTSLQVAGVLRPLMEGLVQEEMIVLHLSARHFRPRFVDVDGPAHPTS